MPHHNQTEIEKLPALVQKNQQSTEDLRKMVENLVSLVEALEAKDRQRTTKRIRKKASKK